MCLFRDFQKSRKTHIYPTHHLDHTEEGAFKGAQTPQFQLSPLKLPILGAGNAVTFKNKVFPKKLLTENIIKVKLRGTEVKNFLNCSRKYLQ